MDAFVAKVGRSEAIKLLAPIAAYIHSERSHGTEPKKEGQHVEAKVE
jgi:hypothetical protein